MKTLFGYCQKIQPAYIYWKRCVLLAIPDNPTIVCELWYCLSYSANVTYISYDKYACSNLRKTIFIHYSSPTGGSFIRPKKVDTGYSCFLAINDRYGKTADAHAGVIVDDLFVVDENKKQTKVEMVGAEKVNKKQR